MSVRRLPERPNLDQLKHQAKELLAVWRSGASADAQASATALRLRDAQRTIAQEYGFDSWDALRLHVEAIAGPSRRASRATTGVLDYDDPIPHAIEVNEPLSAALIERLVEQRISAVARSQVPADTLSRLKELLTLRGL